MNKKRILYFALILMLILLFIFKDSFFQPRAEDLRGGFKEIAFTRNEQNTGPILRLYTVSVEDTIKPQYRSFGNLMPHTKYGVTRVFFFADKQPVPRQLSLEFPYFDTLKFKPIATYEKNPMGKIVIHQ